MSAEPIRKSLERLEKQTLAPQATFSAESKGRPTPEEECDLRTAFQRDRDRVVHSKSFRRLKHKTQVFLAPTGDHYRTRLTHTLEVAQIGRTIAKCLRLNEDLTEAIALAHDLGHTPFGHAGEAALNRIMPGGFSHHYQSLRVVDKLEKNGAGLNLTHEVREGIMKHSKGKGPILPESPESLSLSMEGRVVRIADIIAYICHDLDDAIRGEVVSEDRIPADCVRVLGQRNSQRIGTMVRDVVLQSQKTGLEKLALSVEVQEAMVKLRKFLYDNVYEVSLVHEEFHRATNIIYQLFETFQRDDGAFTKWIGPLVPQERRDRTICDFVAGMTDRYAVNLFERLFVPRPWAVL